MLSSCIRMQRTLIRNLWTTLGVSALYNYTNECTCVVNHTHIVQLAKYMYMCIIVVIM